MSEHVGGIEIAKLYAPFQITGKAKEIADLKKDLSTGVGSITAKIDHIHVEQLALRAARKDIAEGTATTTVVKTTTGIGDLAKTRSDIAKAISGVVAEVHTDVSEGILQGTHDKIAAKVSMFDARIKTSVGVGDIADTRKEIRSGMGNIEIDVRPVVNTAEVELSRADLEKTFAKDLSVKIKAVGDLASWALVKKEMKEYFNEGIVATITTDINTADVLATREAIKAMFKNIKVDVGARKAGSIFPEAAKDLASMNKLTLGGTVLSSVLMGVSNRANAVSAGFGSLSSATDIMKNRWFGWTVLISAGIPVIMGGAAAILSLGSAMGAASIAGIGMAAGLSRVINPIKQILQLRKQEKAAKAVAGGQDATKDIHAETTAEWALADAISARSNAASDRAGIEQRSERDVRNAKEQAARFEVLSLRSERNAQEQLDDAMGDRTKAAISMSDALKAATRAQRDYDDQLKGAALDENGAKLALISAREELSKANKDRQAGLINNLQLAESQQKYNEALLNYNTAQKKTKDTEEDIADARAKGIGGSDVVQAAQKQAEAVRRSVRDAQDNLDDLKNIDNPRQKRDNNEAVGDAEVNYAQTQRDQAALAVSSQHAVEQAEWAKQAAYAATGKSLEDYGAKEDDILAGLTKTEADFVNHFLDVTMPAGRDISKKINDALLPPLQGALGIFEANAGVIGDTLANLSGTLGQSVLSGMKSATTDPIWVEFWGHISKEGPGDVQDLATTIGNATTGVIGLFNSFAPLKGGVLSDIKTATENFKIWASDKNPNSDVSRLVRFLQKEGPGIKDNVGKIKDGVVAIFTAGGVAATETILPALGWAFQKIAEVPQDRLQKAIELLIAVKGVSMVAGALSGIAGFIGLVSGGAALGIAGLLAIPGKIKEAAAFVSHPIQGLKDWWTRYKEDAATLLEEGNKSKKSWVNIASEGLGSSAAKALWVRSAGDAPETPAAADTTPAETAKMPPMGLGGSMATPIYVHVVNPSSAAPTDLLDDVLLGDDEGKGKGGKGGKGGKAGLLKAAGSEVDDLLLNKTKKLDHIKLPSGETVKVTDSRAVAVQKAMAISPEPLGPVRPPELHTNPIGPVKPTGFTADGGHPAVVENVHPVTPAATGAAPIKPMNLVDPHAVPASTAAASAVSGGGTAASGGVQRYTNTGASDYINQRSPLTQTVSVPAPIDPVTGAVKLTGNQTMSLTGGTPRVTETTNFPRSAGEPIPRATPVAPVAPASVVTPPTPHAAPIGPVPAPAAAAPHVAPVISPTPTLSPGLVAGANTPAPGLAALQEQAAAQAARNSKNPLKRLQQAVADRKNTAGAGGLGGDAGSVHAGGIAKLAGGTILGLGGAIGGSMLGATIDQSMGGSGATGGMVGGIAGGLGASMLPMLKTMPAALKGLPSAAKELGAGAKGLLTSVRGPGGLGTVAKGLGGGLLKGGGGLLKLAGGPAMIASMAASIGGGMIKDGKGGTRDFAGSTISRVGTYAGIGGMIGSIIPGVGTGIGAGVGAAAGLAVSIIKDPKAAKKAVQDISKEVGDFAVKSGKAIGGFASDAGAKISGWAGGAKDSATKAFDSITGGAGLSVQGVSSAFSNSQGAIAGPIGMAAYQVGTHWNEISAGAGAAKDVAVGKFNDLKDGAVTAVTNLKDGAVTKFNDLKDGAAGKLNDIKGGFEAFKKDPIAALEATKNMAVEKFSGMANEAKGKLNSIGDFFGVDGLGDKLSKGAEKLMHMFADGLNAGKEYLAGVGKSVFGVLSNLVPQSPVKQGPLRAFNNGAAGKKLVGFLGDGIEMGADGLHGKARAVMSSLGDILQDNPEWTRAHSGKGVATGILAKKAAIQASGLEMGRQLMGQGLAATGDSRNSGGSKDFDAILREHEQRLAQMVQGMMKMAEAVMEAANTPRPFTIDMKNMNGASSQERYFAEQLSSQARSMGMTFEGRL